MIHVCRADGGCALSCHTVMRSKSKVLENDASASSGLIGKTARSAHITSSPFCLRWRVSFNVWQGVQVSVGEIEGVFVHELGKRVEEVSRKEHKDLTVSWQRKSKCSSCGRHSNAPVGLTHTALP